MFEKEGQNSKEHYMRRVLHGADGGAAAADGGGGCSGSS